MSTHDKWATPDYVVQAMMDIIEPALSPSVYWLEPSAGDGAIVRGLVYAGVSPKMICAIEQDPAMAAHHSYPRMGVKVHCANFLTWNPPHRNMMGVANPPFTGTQTLQHIEATCSMACARFIRRTSGGFAI